MAAAQTLVNNGNTPVKATSEVEWLHHALLHIGNCAGDESAAQRFPNLWPLIPERIPEEVKRIYKTYISDLNTAWPEYWQWFARTEGKKVLDLVSKLTEDVTKKENGRTVRAEPGGNFAPSHRQYVEMIKNIEIVLRCTSKDRLHTSVDINVLRAKWQVDEERLIRLENVYTNKNTKQEELRKHSAWLYRAMDYLKDVIVKKRRTFPVGGLKSSDMKGEFGEYRKYLIDNILENWGFCWKSLLDDSNPEKEKICLFEQVYQHIANISSRSVWTLGLKKTKVSKEAEGFAEELLKLIQTSLPDVDDVESREIAPALQADNQMKLDHTQDWNPIFQFFNPPNVVQVFCKKHLDRSEEKQQDIGDEDRTDLREKHEKERIEVTSEAFVKASVTNSPGDHAQSDHEVQKRIFSTPPKGNETGRNAQDGRYVDESKKQKSERNRDEERYNELRITKQFYQELCEQVLHVFKTERLDDQTFMEAVPEVTEASRMKMTDTSIQMRKYFQAYQKRRADLRNSIGQLKEEAKTTKEEKDKLLKRLSEMTGCKLKAGNRAITDLSDPNRPQKIAEKFSEVYDNEWTNAFEEIGGMTRKSEREIIQILLNAVTNCHMFCMTASKDMWDSHCKVYLGERVNNINEYAEQNEWSDIDKKNFLDSYRSGMALAFNKVKKDFMGQIVMGQIEMKNTKAYRIYVTSCLRLCWLMALQDPPMYVDSEFRRGNFDEKRYKFYTASGRQMYFIVWPVLHTYRGGPIISKGVAQPRR